MATERLARVRTGCPTSWASPPVKWRRGRDSNSRGQWPRRVSSALGWSPREDFNLHYRVRSPGVCALAYEGNGWRPGNRTATLSVVTSRGIEPRSLGLRPSAMTTLARWSEWSRRRESNPRLRVTRAPCFRQHFVDVVQARGFEPGSSRLTAGRVAVATTLQAKTKEAGCQTWTRTTIRGVRGRCPAVGRSGNGRVGRTRTSTRLRPRQVGYRLPYDPMSILAGTTGVEPVLPR
jgi:hypothetical protein